MAKKIDRKGVKKDNVKSKKNRLNSREKICSERSSLKKNLANVRRGIGSSKINFSSLNCTSIQEVAAKSQLKLANFDANALKGSQLSKPDSSKRAYMKELTKVIKNADVILYVVDARDPMGCRNQEVENRIMSLGGKKLVLVLNKVDLIPADIASQWIKHLRKEFPTVPFRANTGNCVRQNSNPDTSRGVQYVPTGSDDLLQLLKNYSRSNEIKLAITVGIVGYPNVGKSSIVNTLKRNKAVGVSPVAGYTKVMQEVVLDRKIRLLDCPGIVFSADDENAILLRNCVDSSKDPMPAIKALFTRCTVEQLQQLYCIKLPEATSHAFLSSVAKKRGKLLKGGIPDLMGAAKLVLQDWNRGKIPFYTSPPVADNAVVYDTRVVNSYDQEFDIQTTAQVNVMKDDASLPKSVIALPRCSEKVDVSKCLINTDSDSDDSLNDDKTTDGPVTSLLPVTFRSKARHAISLSHGRTVMDELVYESLRNFKCS